MARKTAPTASNLASHLYKFVQVDPATGFLSVVAVAGVAPSGVLMQVYVSGGQQFGIYDDSDVVTMKGGGVITKGAEVQSNATGFGVMGGPGINAGVAQSACLGAGKSFSVRLFPAATPSIGVVAAPAAELLYGTGVGSASSPNMKFTPGTATLAQRDAAAVALFTSNGDAANRKVTVFDAAGVAITENDTKAANRILRIFDSAGNVQAKMDTKLGSRVMSLTDTAGNPIIDVDGVTAVRTVVVSDDLGVPMESTDTTSAARTVEYLGAAGDPVLRLNLKGGSEAMNLGGVGNSGLDFDLANETLTAKDSLAATRWILNLRTGVTSTPAVTPAGMGVTENNYALATGLFNRLTGNAANTSLTGIVAESDGARKLICNISNKGITLENMNVGSVAANQIQTSTGAGVLIAPKASAELVYDGTAGFWRQLWVT